MARRIRIRAHDLIKSNYSRDCIDSAQIESYSLLYLEARRAYLFIIYLV